MKVLEKSNTLISLNQGQGSIFKLRECAQSIFRIKLPLEKSFLQKFKKNFFRKCRCKVYLPLKGVPFEALSPKKFCFSKLADFWYLGVVGHEKSIGASPEFRKNFHEILSKNFFFEKKFEFLSKN